MYTTSLSQQISRSSVIFGVCTERWAVQGATWKLQSHSLSTDLQASAPTSAVVLVEPDDLTVRYDEYVLYVHGSPILWLLRKICSTCRTVGRAKVLFTHASARRFEVAATHPRRVSAHSMYEYVQYSRCTHIRSPQPRGFRPIGGRLGDWRV